MMLILLTVVLAILKYFDISFFGKLSWWWVAGVFLFTFIWFEFIERMLGLDKKKAHRVFEEIQKNRAKRNFEKKS